jgi:hypothetical protein
MRCRNGNDVEVAWPISTVSWESSEPIRKTTSIVLSENLVTHRFGVGERER